MGRRTAGKEFSTKKFPLPLHNIEEARRQATQYLTEEIWSRKISIPVPILMALNSDVAQAIAADGVALAEGVTDTKFVDWRERPAKETGPVGIHSIFLEPPEETSSELFYKAEATKCHINTLRIRDDSDYQDTSIKDSSALRYREYLIETAGEVTFVDFGTPAPKLQSPRK